VLLHAEAADSPRARDQAPPARKSPPAARRPPEQSTQQLAEHARNSVVRIRTRGRDGGGEGVGTGFVVGSDGLIATSLHVIGEGRPFDVRFPDGTEATVLTVHAWDRTSDLALLRIDRTGLAALPLGDSEAFAQGAPAVALGNPLGLDYSVVEGVLSGRRDLEGIPMLQLAIPIEPGNSGGPVLDRAGNVQGILNAKSLLTRNLGFATPVNRLKPLLDHPSPMPIDRWLRLGAIDTRLWQSHLGGTWRQKGGQVQVEGTGSGFGGRTFLLSAQVAPEIPYEVRVTVKLADESGAAGLVFSGSDDGRHYGFYPTGGRLRLTAFEGPEINSWRILGTVPSTAYRGGDWNELGVRVEGDRIQCSVNGERVFETRDRSLAGLRVGLASFRGTAAAFRGFQVRKAGPSSGEALPADLIAAFDAGRESIEALRTNLPASEAFLNDRARRLESEASRLRSLALRLQRESDRDALVAELAQPEDRIHLIRAALLLARHDQPGLDVDAYQRQVDSMAEELRPRLVGLSEPVARVAELRRFLFEEQGFHGSRGDYHNNANSHLNQVLDDREGIPISLSLLFLEVGRAAGIPNLHGLPLPGHFLVKHSPPGADARLYDPFHGGVPILFSDADDLGSESAGVPVRSELMEPASKRAMLVRMLDNLRAFNLESGGPEAALPYLDLLVALADGPRVEANRRIDRARLRAQAGNRAGAAEDLRRVLALEAPGIELDRISNALRAVTDEP